MTTARRRCVVLATAGLAGLSLATGCTGGDDEPALESLEFQAETDATAPPASEQGGDATASALAEATFLGSYTLTDELFGTEVAVTVGQGLRIIETNALPDHETGSFPNPGNPNAIAGQTLRYEFPADPQHLDRAAPAQTPAVAVNGIPFEPGTAEMIECQSGERYQIEALQELYDLGLDANNAHVQPTGKYHYHGLPTALAEIAAGDDQGLVHVGFAADGFLVFVSPTGQLKPGYRLSADPRTGTGCSYRGTEIAIDGTPPDGTYASDWRHDPEIGDLDACNGLTIDDEYVYLVTETYPFVPRCLMGDFTDPGPTGAAPNGGGPGRVDDNDDDDEEGGRPGQPPRG